MNSQGLGKLTVNFIRKIKRFKRSWQVAGSFHKKFFDCDFSQNSKISCLEVEDSKRSDKLNSFTHNFNDLHEIRLLNTNSLIFGHISISSLRNKFEILQEVIGNNIDVLLISETKLDASFPSSQFILDGLTTPYRLDRTQYEGGIVLFMREGIPSKLLNADTSIGIENLLVEINLIITHI